MSALALVLDVFAAYRLTRFVTADVLGGIWIRWPIIRWAYLRAGHEPEMVGPKGPQLDVLLDADLAEGRVQRNQADDGDHGPSLPPSLAVLVRCRWCAGIWVAAAVAAARWTIPDVWDPIAWGLTAATAAVLLAGLEQD